MEELLRSAAEEPFAAYYYRDALKSGTTEEWESLLDGNGRFTDLDDDPAGALTAVGRLACMAEPYRWNTGEPWPENGLKRRVLLAAARYCRIEADRKDVHATRFHQSIFRFPTCAINLYFMLYPDMEAAAKVWEREEERAETPELMEAYRQILRISMQPWTLPRRDDGTDDNPVCVERFRGHVWWVGANALAYRPLFYSALVQRNPAMMDVLVTVAAGALLPVSAATADQAFWSEGICADGFGWGHGRQAYNRGYPTEGVAAALRILAAVRNTDWEDRIQKLDFQWVINYIRGITWSGWRGISAPMQTRNIFLRDESVLEYPRLSEDGHALLLAGYLRQSFWDLLREEEQREIEGFLSHGASLGLGEKDGRYEGIRYFWNSESLISKREDRYFYVNMASSRRDGVESADFMADRRNYYTADGSYVIMRDGGEYRDAMGTWQVCRLPGITARQLLNRELAPETNWHGYHSCFDFACGVDGAAGGAAGFICEKDGAREADGAGVVYDRFTKEMLGIRGYKGYFLIDDTVVCLGADITDVRPEFGREVRTTINNTGWRTAAELFDQEGNLVEILAETRKLAVPEDWIYLRQDGILYGVRGPAALLVSAELRMSHWQDLNAGNRKVEDREYPVFELSVSHGVNPSGKSYEYLMYMGDKNPREYLRCGKPIVLINTKQVQAAARADLSLIQMIFYEKDVEAGVPGMMVSVSSPAAVMIERRGEDVEMVVCDGLQREGMEMLTVRINGEMVDVRLPGECETGRPVRLVYPGKVGRDWL